MTTLKAVIPAADYLFVTRFSSHEDTRYYLNGVFVCTLDGDRTRPAVVATDGHRLGVIRFNEGEAHFGEGCSFIISNRTDIVRACKVGKYDKAFLRCLDDRLEVVTAKNLDEAVDGPFNVTCTFPASTVYVDGTFPDWTRIIPSDCSGVRDGYALNANYLADFAIDKRNAAAVSVEFNGTDPMLVANTDPRFLGVLMPMRGGVSASDFAARRASLLASPLAVAAE